MQTLSSFKDHFFLANCAKVPLNSVHFATVAYGKSQKYVSCSSVFKYSGAPLFIGFYSIVV